MTTKEIGDIGERAAAKYLKKHKYKISGRNRHFSHNEIDIIAEDKSFIVFVEVKTRTVESTEELGNITPSIAVNHAKRTRTLSAARAYLRLYPTKKQPRIDVIEVWLNVNSLKTEKINHIENAFGA